MERQPNVHEEMLDFTFVESVGANSGPHRTPSDTVVDIDIHFVGGGWHYERWEVADIGLIVVFRRLSEVLRRKIVLLQSKRLYPREAEFIEAHGLARPGGFGYLARVDEPDIRQPRLFRFDRDCRYRALQIGDQQWAVIADYEHRYGIPVHYMLYHPSTVPWEAQVPVQVPLTPSPARDVGTRVLQSGLVRANLTAAARNYAPSFDDLAAGARAPGQTLSEFITDAVLACTEGYAPDDFLGDDGINRVFNLRSGPIAAAILIDIDLSEAVEEESAATNG